MSAEIISSNRSAQSSASGQEGRVPWVDYAKGICIILVVMMHTTNQVQEMAGQVGFMEYVVAFARPFRMPDFFLLSGLFLGVVIGRDWRIYTDRKVVHFAYFYVLWVVISFGYKAPAWVVKGTWDKFIEFPVAFIQPLGTLWFIYLLPIFFVVTKLIVDRKISMVLVWIIAAGLESAQIYTGWVVVDEFCARWVYFLTGYALASYAFDLARWAGDHPTASVTGLATWAVINAILVFAPNPLSSERTIASMPIISLLLGFAGAYAVIVLGALLERSGTLKFVRYCGTNSIVIYLAFFLTLTPLRYVVARYDLNVGWSTLVITIISVLFPLAMERVVRNTPLNFLFVRPAWCHLKGVKPKPAVKIVAQDPVGAG